MTDSTRTWRRGLYGTLATIALIGLAIAVWIVRNEGVDGLWKRKRQWIEGTSPEMAPVLDRVEQAVGQDKEAAKR